MGETEEYIGGGGTCLNGDGVGGEGVGGKFRSFKNIYPPNIRIIRRKKFQKFKFAKVLKKEIKLENDG